MLARMLYSATILFAMILAINYSRGVATVVSILPRNPLACRNVGGAAQ